VLLVGTSGWQYRDWRERFYPRGVPQRQWLQFYADRFATVEINSAFYRLPEWDTFRHWREQTPQDFCAAVKVSRYLTHVRRLHDPAEAVARFLERAAGLGAKFGPALLQLPPSLVYDPALLRAVLAEFPDGVRVAVEPRHASWWVPEARRTLEKYGAALCWADRGGRPVGPLWRTAGWAYLRMHAGRAQPRPRYGRTALRSWVRRIEDAFGREPDGYVYFNNDAGGAAIEDARSFAAAARRQGLPASRAGEPTASWAVRTWG
jgi:uncharacterized protein YecE (DUF72 family)